MVTLKLARRGVSVSDVGQSTIRRGAEIFGLGMLFRLQEFLVALGWAPWSDLLRVDILNSIGTAMMLMGLACWAVAVAGGGLRALACMGVAVTVAIATLTPLLWTVWRPHWLPWPIESYLDGVHNQGVPQRGLFPIFPWAGFAFAGLALGFVLFSAWAKGREAAVVAGAGLAGLAIGGCCLLDRFERGADLSSLRFLAHQPEFLFHPVGRVVSHSHDGLRLVPVGIGSVGIQSDGAAGPNFIAGLLGSHRAGIRESFDSA